MTPEQQRDSAPAGDRHALRVALVLVLGLTAARLAALLLSPLELYPDEAQYWLWSREPAFGYFSKPPMVAWLTGLTTALFGDAEAAVRLSSPLLHGAAGLLVYAAARRLADARTALLACALYSLMPGVQLSSVLLTTDAALLCFTALALLGYVRLLQARRTAEGLAAAALFGAGLGLAFLGKYAAVYPLIGAALHAAASGAARRAWSPLRLATAAGVALLLVAPNLLWNAGHGFATVAHTAANANWGGSLLHPAELLDFLVAQLGVFGPIPFAVLLAGAAVLALRRRTTSETAMLLCWTLPPILIVAIQALLSRSNANWAAAAYVSGAVLTALWLRRGLAGDGAGRGWRRLATGGTLAVQGVAAALFLAAVVSPPVIGLLGLDNAFKRARGWRATTAAVLDAAQGRGAGAVAVDDRFLFNALAYYGRERLARPGAPALRMWVRERSAQNQAEAEAPLRPGTSGAVLAASLIPDYTDEMRADFTRAGPPAAVEIRLDRKRTRRLTLFTAEGFAPRPRPVR